MGKLYQPTTVEISGLWAQKTPASPGYAMFVAAEKLLAGKQRPTAIFCGNDEMAAGVYKVAMRAGISIPRELSVVGYDDSPLATRLWPSLTSVRRQTRDTGRIAASMLIRPDAGPLPVASVRPHLIVRDSCQPPA